MSQQSAFNLERQAVSITISTIYCLWHYPRFFSLTESTLTLFAYSCVKALGHCFPQLQSLFALVYTYAKQIRSTGYDVDT